MIHHQKISPAPILLYSFENTKYLQKSMCTYEHMYGEHVCSISINLLVLL